MPHTFETYLNFHKKALEGTINWTSDVIKMALFKNTLTKDLQNHGIMDDINTNEINNGNGDINGYFAGFGGTGRQTLTVPTAAVGATSVSFDAVDLTFPALGAALSDVAYLVVYKHLTSDALSPVLLIATLNPVFSPDGNDLNVQFNSAGVFVTQNG